jgi:hypothetical protein
MCEDVWIVFLFADLVCLIDICPECIPDIFWPFKNERAECVADLLFAESQNYRTYGELVFMEHGLRYLKGERGTQICSKGQAQEILSVMTSSPEWKYIKIFTENPNKHMIKAMSEIAFRTRILFYNGLVIHAAAIDYQGKGILFSAPAGTGKTTQAKLWQKYYGAEIINGDRPAIRCDGRGGVFLYGTPWSGSSNDCINRRVPLSALVMVRQYPVNRLRRLSRLEALGWVLPRCFLPYWDKSLMDLALSNLEEILKLIDIYLLECRPDQEAAEILRRELSCAPEI